MLALGKELSPQQRVSKCTVDILSHPRYLPLSGILMIGERAVCTVRSGPYGTAATNGRDEYYHPDMVSELSDAEMRFVILHEARHKMMRHLITWRELWEIDPVLANQAADHWNNLGLLEENKDGFAVMPGGQYKGLADERFKGMNTAQIFNILRQEKQDGGGDEGDGDESQDGDEQGGGGGGSGQPDENGNEQGGFDTHDWKGAQELTEQEQQQLERDIDEAIRQGALAAGKAGGGEAIDVSELLKPQVDWKQVLREFVKSTCAGSDYSTYNRPNRRYMGTGIIMPSGVSEQIGELIFAIDMSGSTGIGRVRQHFLTECIEACKESKPEKVRLIYWDSQVRNEETYIDGEYDNMHNLTKPMGNGGTVVRSVSDYIQEKNIKAQAVVVLSDGDLCYGDQGTWHMPVLWCVIDAPNFVGQQGKTLHLESDRF